MARATHEYEIDDECEVTLVTRKRLGHVADVNDAEIPTSLLARHEAELAAYHDAQRCAFGVEDAAAGAFESRFGKRLTG